jgi:secreted PhoX family phosphatase
VALPAGAETALRPMAAAERAGATRFDLPSGLAIDGRTGRAYLACRGNAARTPGQVDPMNPRAGNASGHVIEWVPAGGDHAAETASAGPLFIAGDPSQPGSGARYGRGAGSPVPPGATWPESPDTLSVDDRSRLWIGTNRGGRPLDQPEALFACDLAGAMRGVPVPLYGAPRGAAIGGTASSPEGDALFAMVRHPGLEPGASFEAQVTGWPSFEPGMPPRSTLVTFARSRGGRVGG